MDGVEELLVPAEAAWPHVRLHARVDRSTLEHEYVDGERARIKLRSGGDILVERRSGRAEFTVPQALTPHELVHPYLAPVAAVMAHWLERDSFHAGAFERDGAAIAVLAEREGGKSSTLAQLAILGRRVVCDDMLVVEEGSALAGPRSLDLRQATAEALGAGTHLGRVGARERWRLVLDPVRPRLPLRAWVFLAWGERLEAERLPARETVKRLFANLGLRLPPRPDAILELATLPAWELRRPLGLAGLDETVDYLIATVSG
jgi:hypothetical protein